MRLPGNIRCSCGTIGRTGGRSQSTTNGQTSGEERLLVNIGTHYEFIERYTTGDPSEGFTTEEAIAYLREMRDEMTPGEFRRAMQRTLEHLPPSQRDEFITIMREYQSGTAQPATGSAATAASTSASGVTASDAPPAAASARGACTHRCP